MRGEGVVRWGGSLWGGGVRSYATQENFENMDCEIRCLHEDAFLAFSTSHSGSRNPSTLPLVPGSTIFIYDLYCR